MKSLETAILLIIFKRHDETRKVFESIRKARPPRLYVAADGPRKHKHGEIEKCEATRAIIADIDWPCDVKTLFRDQNIGSRLAVSGAIDWFFQHESEGIILEDDCLPAQSFYWFCEAMLERYRHDYRMGQIAGSCFFQDRGFQGEPKEGYFFSRHIITWGWATWRRAWQYYDVNLSMMSVMTSSRWLDSINPNPTQRKALLRLVNRALSNDLDAWDYQWAFTLLYQSMLSIVPTKNLIVNIGWGSDATHTSFRDPRFPIQAYEMEFPIIDPPFVLPDAYYDRVFGSIMFQSLPAQKLRSVLNRIRDTNYMKLLLKGKLDRI